MILNNKNLVIALFLTAFFLSGCRKEEGLGGKATIRGKVYVLDYNNDFSNLIDEYYIGNEDVFIIYGDEGHTYHDKVDTHFDGSYEFRYLKKGTYTVYAYSKDMNTNNGDPRIPILKTVEIDEKSETVIVEDIVIVD